MKGLNEQGIKELVLDVLKPHAPSLPEFANFLGELEDVNIVDVSLVEMDEKTESLKVVLNGNNINFSGLKEHIEKLGASIHSVDRVIIERKK